MTQTDFRAELEPGAARMLHFGVSYGDFRKAAASPDWASFSDALVAMAAQYDAAGDEAARAERSQSAAELWRRAAVYFHYAQLKLRAGERKNELQSRCRASYAKAASRFEPAAKRVAVRFEGSSFHGYLRLPRERAQACVVLINGLDSAKEVELHAFAEGFLRRGNAVFAWDGPGQAEGRNTLPMHRYSSVVSAVLDALRAELGDVAFGVFGVSYGGFLAGHAAASDRRIEACVSLGGFHDARVFARLPLPALDNLRIAYDLPPDSDVAILDDVVTLEPLRGRLHGRLLIMHGTNDHLVDAAQIEALQTWAGSHAETLIFEGAEHVCTDRFPEALPALWDWMTTTLQPAAIPAEAWS